MSRVLEPDRMHAWREASEWHVKLRGSDVTDEDFAKWIEWCESSPANIAAYEEIDSLFEKSARSPKRAQQWKSMPPAAWIPLAAAAAVAGVLWFSFAKPPASVSPDAVVQSAPAQNREALLPDGSTLALSAKSAVSLQFAAHERRLIVDEGEAFFKVTHDKARPFVVDAGDVLVRAVGTAFDVRRNRDRIVVSVAEGVVEVTEARAGNREWRSEAPVRIAAGFQYVWDRSDARVRLTEIDPMTAGAWRQGRLEYISEPFGAVVANVNRYSRSAIRIADPECERLVFTGTVLTDGIDDWLDALPRAFAVDVERQRDGSIVIRKRAT